MATVNPATVVIKASEMPPANTAGLPTPELVMFEKMLIMPSTVPYRPNRGVTAAMEPRVLR